MEKVLDLNKTVAELVGEYPELKQAMAEIGFQEITNPVALQLMGRVMTIPKGVAVKGMDLSEVIEGLKRYGFSVMGDAQGCTGVGSGRGGDAFAPTNPMKSPGEERLGILKNLLARLSSGESPEAVRQDFVRNFKSVSAEEIASAEQQLIRDGMPIREVRNLCDIHSALFHGKTAEETTEHPHQAATATASPDIKSVPIGHPIHILCLENEELAKILDAAEKALTSGEKESFAECLKKMTGLYVHYGKKEMLLMPLLYRYGVTGPSGIMWGVDDEIKRELRAISQEMAADSMPSLQQRAAAWLQRIREMIYKEEKILFPLTLRYFTEEEWFMVYRDTLVFGNAFLADAPPWEDGEIWVQKEIAEEQKALAEQGMIHLPTGEVSVPALYGILSLLPVDITFIDKDDIFRFFVNEGRIFERPRSALGGRVENCHPAEVVPVIHRLLEDFKTGKRDSMEVWKKIKGKPVSVQYFAVRDTAGDYLGTLEVVQDFSKALEHFGDAS
ncbi:MAG: DUF438 domain-containing protein [Selenomonadaceae bacterium]|nr:DUF438 domain-containing protein [Selenomonadaceae bacterium]